MSDRFEKHALTVTVLTFLSRVTGLARDAAMSRIFGNGAVMDAFSFAFMIPNLFRRLFGEGALSAAFLPVYSQLDRSDPATARRLAALTLGLMIAALGGLTLVGEAILAFALARADGTGGSATLAIRLMMIMLPYMPMVCLVAILGATLQVHGKFGPTAAAPVILNLCIVAAAVGFVSLSKSDGVAAHAQHITIVAWSVIVAGALQIVWSIAALQRSPGRLHLRARDSAAPAAGPHLKRVLAQAWPMFIGLGVLQVNTFIDGLVASYPTTFGPTIFGYDFPLDPGALASLNFAQRLYEFPLGVFGIAIATAIFPALSRAHGDGPLFVNTLRRGLRLVVFIGLPASVGLILVRDQLTATVFQGGDFSARDTARVSFVLMGYAPAIWAYSMTHVLTRAFYARGDSMTPVKTATAMVALNFLLNITLIWTPLKEAGLAWSTAICAMIQSVILVRLLERGAGELGSIVDGAVVRSWVRTGVVTLVMTGVVLVVAWYLPHAITWRAAIVQLAALVAAGGIATLLAAMAMRMPELKWVFGRVGQ